jgi:hypothetical protein
MFFEVLQLQWIKMDFSHYEKVPPDVQKDIVE